MYVLIAKCFQEQVGTGSIFLFLLLLSAHIKRFRVSCMQNFFLVVFEKPAKFTFFEKMCTKNVSIRWPPIVSVLITQLGSQITVSQNYSLLHLTALICTELRKMVQH